VETNAEEIYSDPPDKVIVNQTKTQNDEVYKPYSSPTVNVIKSTKIKRTEHTKDTNK
jgi:hypothetical protein